MKGENNAAYMVAVYKWVINPLYMTPQESRARSIPVAVPLGAWQLVGALKLAAFQSYLLNPDLALL